MRLAGSCMYQIGIPCGSRINPFWWRTMGLTFCVWDPERTLDSSGPGEQTREAPSVGFIIPGFPPGSQLQLSLHSEALRCLFGIFSVKRPVCLLADSLSSAQLQLDPSELGRFSKPPAGLLRRRAISPKCAAPACSAQGHGPIHFRFKTHRLSSCSSLTTRKVI